VERRRFRPEPEPVENHSEDEVRKEERREEQDDRSRPETRAAPAPTDAREERVRAAVRDDVPREHERDDVRGARRGDPNDRERRVRRNGFSERNRGAGAAFVDEVGDDADLGREERENRRDEERGRLEYSPRRVVRVWR